MEITTKQRKALEILASKRQVSARDFALRMWTDSNMHKKVSNQGNGATRGKAGWLCGGSYLSKLEILGLAKRSRWDENGNHISISTFEITEKGKLLIQN